MGRVPVLLMMRPQTLFPEHEPLVTPAHKRRALQGRLIERGNGRRARRTKLEPEQEARMEREGHTARDGDRLGWGRGGTGAGTWHLAAGKGMGRMGGAILVASIFMILRDFTCFSFLASCLYCGSNLGGGARCSEHSALVQSQPGRTRTQVSALSVFSSRLCQRCYQIPMSRVLMLRRAR